MMRALRLFFIFLFATTLLTSCARFTPHRGDGPPADAASIDVSRIPNAVPVALPLCRYGNYSTYTVFGKQYHVMASSIGYRQRGIASWYGTQFQDHRTSCGEPYNLYAMTAASKTLPLPTFVRVTNLENGRQVIVKVNDRGPFADNRIIDLSYVAARKLGMMQKGTALVEVVAIDPLKTPHNTFTSLKPQIIHHPTPHIYLDVGTFSHAESAAALAKKLHAYASYGIFTHVGHKGSEYTYTVRIGPFTSVDDADHVSEAISRAGFGRPIERVN